MPLYKKIKSIAFLRILLFGILFPFYAFALQPSFLENPDTQAQKLLETLSLREKIGQLFMIAASSISPEIDPSMETLMKDCPYDVTPDHVKKMIKEYHIGGLIFIFKSEPALQRAQLAMYQKESKIPLLIGQDLEWGLSQTLDHDPSKVTRYPHLMTLGALSENNEHLIYELAKEIGLQCAQVGVHMNFGPVADVNNNPQNPVIHDRSFGDDPEKVARLAVLYARGLQDAGIIACAKHFPGHGDTNIDSHLDLPRIVQSSERLNTTELLPFKALINAGIGGVMNAHLVVPALDATPNLPSSMSHDIVTQLLKESLAFKGLVITDGLGMQAITNHYKPGDLELQAFRAGNDILLLPLDVPRAIDLIEQAIQNGDITQEELDRRVLKILQAKHWAIAQQKQHMTHDADAYLVRPEATALQSELYRKTITVARNTLSDVFSEQLLQRSCIIQVGGISNELFKERAPHLLSVPATMPEDAKNLCIATATNYDTVIMLIQGMNKFAQKDFGISDATRALLAQLKKDGKKIITVVFGSPYSLHYFDDADTVIMAYAYKDPNALWQAIIDVLSGTAKAEGILPVTVPL